jgi:hypothetical protein
MRALERQEDPILEALVDRRPLPPSVDRPPARAKRWTRRKARRRARRALREATAQLRSPIADRSIAGGLS